MPFIQIHDAKQNPFNDGTGYNDFPHGWREITEGEFSQSPFFSYHPDYVEFRQMLDKNKPSVPAVSATLNWLWDRTGYSIVNDYHAKTVRFYTFGCDHKMQQQPDYVLMCVNCGFHHPRQDSSD
jgi:hypothetical protein